MPSNDDAQTLPTATSANSADDLRSTTRNTPSPDRDRYALGVPIGRGGMGEVRLAHDVRIDRDVAVKLMRPDMRDDASTMRFYREARIQGRLDHPAIPPVYDLGVDDHGNPYFVMKRLTGTTLYDVLKTGSTKWPRRLLLTKLIDVCLAIELAHAREIVHRDLKPSNIMLGDYGEVYVLDWGVARVVDARRSQPAPLVLEPDARATAVGEIIGTPGYMAPEQLRDAAVDGRADVYALGCILYEVVTGEPALPHGKPALEETLMRPCRRPSDRFPDAPPELDDLCARATAADSTARPSARELADGIQAYLDGDRDVARRRELASQHAKRSLIATRRANADGRAEAIREAGRALALDPGNAQAQAVLGRMMLDAPNELPSDVAAEIERDRSETRQVVLRWITLGYLGVAALFATTLIALRVVHPVVVFAGLASSTAAACRAWIGSRHPLRERSPVVAQLFVLNAANLAAVAIVFGPLVLAPMFVITSIAIGLVQPTGFSWLTTVGSQVAGIAVPLVLEWSGVMPPTFHGMALTPWVINATPVQTVVIVLVALAFQIAITAAIVVIRARTQELVEVRLYAMRWHPEQLLPQRKG